MCKCVAEESHVVWSTAWVGRRFVSTRSESYPTASLLLGLLGELQTWVNTLPLSNLCRHLLGRTERRFWADFRLFSDHFSPKMVPHPCYPCYVYISGISEEFGWKNSSLVPHPPFFWPHVYGFRLFSAHFALVLSWRVSPF